MEVRLNVWRQSAQTNGHWDPPIDFVIWIRSGISDRVRRPADENMDMTDLAVVSASHFATHVVEIAGVDTRLFLKLAPSCLFRSLAEFAVASGERPFAVVVAFAHQKAAVVHDPDYRDNRHCATLLKPLSSLRQERGVLRLDRVDLLIE